MIVYPSYKSWESFKKMRKSILVVSSFVATLGYGGSNDVDLLHVPEVLRQVAEDARASLKVAAQSGVLYDAPSMAYFTSVESLMQLFVGDNLDDQSFVDLNSELKTSLEVQESIQEPEEPVIQPQEEEATPDIWAQERLKIADLDPAEIIEVTDNPGHTTDEPRTQNMKGKLINVSQTFNPREYVQRAGDGACQFLSSLASIMSLEKGRAAIENLIVAQDETAVYFRFHPFSNPNAQEMRFNDALSKIYKVPRKFITSYGSYPVQSPDWLHLLMRAYYYLITKNPGLDVMAPNGVLQVQRNGKFDQVWSQLPALGAQQEAFSPLVGKRLTSLSYVEWAANKAQAAYANLKGMFTGAAQNVMNFFRHGHALSMVKTDQGVAAYDNLNGNPDDDSIAENLDNQSFMDAVFAKIRSWGGSVLSYFTEPL